MNKRLRNLKSNVNQQYISAGLKRISGGQYDEEIREKSNGTGDGSSNGCVFRSNGKCRR